MPEVPSADELAAVGAAHGLDALGIAPATPFASTRADLERRKAQGLHDGMGFTYLRPERSTDPEAALAGARALVVAARSYLAHEPDRPAGPAGRVARYAWKDHYADLRAGLTAVARHLKAAGWRARVLADDNALVDREAARRAGLGWYGRNANLLLPGKGSWFVLGAVVTTAPLAPAGTEADDRCGTCTRCLDACPTGAIVAPGVVDARRCLSWLLQRGGPFPREHRVALGDRIYGCDDCQEVCPVNRRSPVGAAAGAGRAWADLSVLLDPDDAVTLSIADRWYIPRREVRHVRRNALVVLGNVGDPRDPAVVDLVRRHLAHADPLLRSHAVWAARRLGLDHLLVAVAEDPDPAVRAELAGDVVARPTPVGVG
ncbi:MAG: tRNA epoxyqueuosine(34) reductase QueG [Acidimicrobiia bacterium]